METADLFGLAFLVVAAVFGSMLFFLIFHIHRTRTEGVEALRELTILIPFKNEMNHLPDMIAGLKSKIEINPAVKVWLLNDHSTDMAAADVERLELNDQIKLIPPVKGITGKKAVWNDAISRVKTEWVLIMDVDTTPPESLFSPHIKLIPHGAKCLLIPIIPLKRAGAVASFFDLDFLSLHFAGLASAKANKPLLANAACMLLNRRAFIESAKDRVDWSEPGGDDVFAMFAIAGAYGSKSISVPGSDKFFASVHFPERAAALWHQRQRWISKTGKIANPWFQFVSWTVLTTQILLLTSLFVLMIYPFAHFTLFAALMIIIAEIIYLAVASAKLKRGDLWPYILPAIFIYPFYLLALVIFGTFAKPKWK